MSMAGPGDNADEQVLLGTVSGAFGVKGWVKLMSYTDPREAILDYEDSEICVDGRWRKLELIDGKRHGKTVIARLDGVDDRDAAEALRGSEIRILRGNLPDAGSERYYWADLLGMQVEHKDGRVLGTLDDMLETGANDVMVVRGEHERLVPFVMGQVVLEVRLADRTIRVDWEWE
jgi:16S rRNA processing protein RimM